MGMATLAQIEIAAPAAEVFRWLVEPAKLMEWQGASGAMPADTSVLGVGWSGQSEITGLGTATVTITGWTPPQIFDFTMSYPGGVSITQYRLTETVGHTSLSCASNTDWGQFDTSAVDAEMATKSAEQQAAMKSELEALEKKLADGAFDDSTTKQMQDAVQASLAKLKGLVEG